MKRLQNIVVERWKLKGLDLVDTSKMHRMAEEAVNVCGSEKSDYVLSWWTTVLIFIIGTVIAWILLYVSVNPQFE